MATENCLTLLETSGEGQEEHGNHTSPKEGMPFVKVAWEGKSKPAGGQNSVYTGGGAAVGTVTSQV